jgi:hypothetical protein
MLGHHNWKPITLDEIPDPPCCHKPKSLKESMAICATLCESYVQLDFRSPGTRLECLTYYLGALNSHLLILGMSAKLMLEDCIRVRSLSDDLYSFFRDMSANQDNWERGRLGLAEAAAVFRDLISKMAKAGAVF